MRALLVPLALIFSIPALAETASADLTAIDIAVAAFTGAAIGQPGGAAQGVDRRLRLRPCAAPLALSWYGTRRDTVMAACPDPGGWRLYVALRSGPAGAATAPLIERGDAVTITVSGTGFAVTQPGEALESGALGAWIKVGRQDTRAEPMRARVLRPGAVGINLP